MTFELTIGFTPVDLYEDETVEINKSVRNIQDLNKLYSAFTKSFNIPATDRNNTLLRHWYDLALVNGIDAAESINGTYSFAGSPTVELCVIELLSVEIDNGEPSSYQIVVYGATRKVADDFGTATLQNLDLSAYNHGLDYTTLRDSWQGNLLNGVIMYPMWDYSRGWIWESTGTQFPDQNIAAITGRIELVELRPAMTIRQLLIEVFKFIGIELIGTWTTDARIDNLYVLPMEKAGVYRENYSTGLFAVENTQIMFLDDIRTAPQKIETFDFEYDAGNNVDLSAQEYTAPFTGNYDFVFKGTVAQLYSQGSDIEFQLRVNGLVAATEVLGLINGQAFNIEFDAIPLNAGDIVWIWASGSNLQRWVTFNTYCIFSCTSAPQSGTSIPINMSEVMPTISINDFVRSCIDCFNLVFYTVRPNTLQVDFLQDYYASGNRVDITPYSDNSTYTIKKGDSPEILAFSHDQQEDVANDAYRNENQKDYGSQEYQSDAEFAQGSLTINTVFQVAVPDLVQQYSGGGIATGNTDLEVVKAYDTDLKPVQLQLLLFYYAGEQSVGIYQYYVQDDLVNNTQIQLNTWPYCRTYSQRPAQTSSYSVAFGLEPVIDTSTENAPTRNLIQEYWLAYVSNTFNRQNRIMTIKAAVPEHIAEVIELNTRILYNNQQYIILSLTFSTSNNIYEFVLERYLLDVQAVPRVQDTNGNSLTIFQEQTSTVSEILGTSTYIDLFQRKLRPLQSTTVTNTQKALQTFAYMASSVVDTAFNINSPTQVSSFVTEDITVSNLAEIVAGDIRINHSGIYRITAKLNIQNNSSNKLLDFWVAKNAVQIGYRSFDSDKDHETIVVDLIEPLLVGDVLTIYADKFSGTGNVNFDVLEHQIIIVSI